LSGLVSLHLNQTMVTDAGLDHIARIETLQILDLDGTSVGSNGLEPLGRLTSLRRLSLTQTSFNDDCAKVVAELGHLEYLNLSHTQVTNDGLAELSQCPQLQEVGLASCNGITDAGIVSLAALPNLTRLGLGDTRITDAALETLCHVERLAALGVEGTSVTDAGIKHLAGLRRLQMLAVHTTRISDAALEVIADMPQLTNLRLEKTQVSDEGIRLLHNSGLTEVWLQSTRVTAEGVSQLHQALSKCRIFSDFGAFDPSISSSAAPNFALKFDGRGAYVDIPSLKYDGSHPLTLEARVQAGTSLAEDRSTTILGNIRNRTRTGGILLRQFEDGWRATVSRVNSAPAYPTAIVDPLGLVDLALVYDLGETRLYVNGKLAHAVATAPAAHLPSAEPFVIGGPAGLKDSTYFDGVIDEVRISRTARYSADYEPQPRLLVDAETLALYHFDEGTGEVLRDASGNGHDGKVVGAAWVPSVSASTDRAVAKWVLAVGGKVTVHLAGEEQPRLIATTETLPDEAWQLVGVDLGYTRVTNVDLARLRGAPGLQGLNLDSAELIGDSGLAHLAGLPLTRLELRGAQITDAGVPTLRELRQLSSLSLQNTGVTDAGMVELARLTQLEHLNVCNNPISDAGLAELRGLTSLKSLGIYDTAITDAGLAHLAAMTSLDYLHLGDTQVSDTGLIHLLPLKQLRHLILNRTGVSDAGLVHLAVLPNIVALWLEGTQITDAGLQHLKPLTTLGDLFVKSTAVTEAGLQQLHADLPGCRILSDFGTFEPANDRAAAEWVLGRQGVVVLRNGDTEVEVRDVSELPLECRVIKVALGAVTDADLVNLQGLAGLQELTLQNCPQLTNSGLGHLRDLPRLRWLILGGSTSELRSQVTDDGMAALLEGFPALEYVSLHFELITDEGLRRLCSKPSLTILRLTGTSITDAGLRHLPNLPLLWNLTLPAQIGDEGLAHLQGTKSLTCLYLAGCDRITGDGLRTLASLPALTEIMLNNTPLTDEDLMLLADSTTLRKLHLRGTKVTQDGIDRLRQALPRCWFDTDFGTFEAANDQDAAE
jgi:Leucine-rich repeat (LRR) protein